MLRSGQEAFCEQDFQCPHAAILAKPGPGDLAAFPRLHCYGIQSCVWQVHHIAHREIEDSTNRQHQPADHRIQSTLCLPNLGGQRSGELRREIRRSSGAIPSAFAPPDRWQYQDHRATASAVAKADLGQENPIAFLLQQKAQRADFIKV
jgi:hypothetical protein